MSAVQIIYCKGAGITTRFEGAALETSSFRVGRSRYPAAGHLPYVACGLCGEGDTVLKSHRLAAFESSSLKSIVLKGLGFLCGTTCKDLKQIFLVYGSAASLKCMSSDLCIC